MEQAFVAMVLAQTPVAALIGARIYPNNLPQKTTYPAMTYRIISGPRNYTQGGADGVVTFRFQCDMFGNTYEQARALKDALLTNVSGKYDVVYGSPAVRIQGVFVANESDSYDDALDAAGPKEFRKTIDLMITARSA